MNPKKIPAAVRTPLLQDKRLMFSMFIVSLVVGLTAIGKPPSEQLLTFLELALFLYVGQSQFGQLQRTKLLAPMLMQQQPPADPPLPDPSQPVDGNAALGARTP